MGTEPVAIRKALEICSQGGRAAVVCRTNGQLLKISRVLDSNGVKYSTTISNATSEEAKRSITVFLKGLLTDDMNEIIDALLTPYSGVTLKEAFELSRLDNERRLDMNILGHSAGTFMKHRDNAFSVESMLRLFDDVVLPISASISKDCYITAVAIARNIREFFATVSAPQISDLFDYLDITEESYEPIGRAGDLVLTTVHKAKGLEFDNVIYVPRDTKEKMSFIDVVVYSVIKAAKGVDIREELEEERLRVDFVAFTRARDRLFIVANDRNNGDYLIGDMKPEEHASMDDEPEPVSRRYDDAYSLFVNHEYEKAKEALDNREEWLNDYIAAYFSNANRLSYTLIEGINDPFTFFKRNIAGLREGSQALSLGSSVHSIAERLFRGTLDEKWVKEQERPYLQNIRAVNAMMEKKYRAGQIDAEKTIVLPLHQIIGARDVTGDMTFKAKIDAIYKNDSIYIILDYKTDKKDDNASGHRRQLATYRKMYAIANGVDEKDIEVALGFVGLRGNVNTGRLDCKLDTNQPKPGQFDTVRGHIEKFLEYKKDPALFAKALKEQPSQGMLHEQLKAQIGEM